MKRRWTRSEKWLLAAPLLVGIFAATMSFGPDLARKKLGLPRELVTPKAELLLTTVLSGDGRILAASGYQLTPTATGINTISFWNAQTLMPLSPMTRAVGGVTSWRRALLQYDEGTFSLALSTDGALVAWGSRAAVFNVMERQTQKKLWGMNMGGRAEQLLFSPNGKWLAIGNGGSYLICEARTGRIVSQWRCGPTPGRTALGFSPDGSQFASIGGRPNQWLKKPNEFGGAIEVRSTRDWKVQRTLDLPNTEEVQFSPDGRCLIGINRIHQVPYVTVGAQMRCFDVATGRVLWEHRWDDGELSNALSVRFAPNGQTIAVLPGRASKIWFFDARDGRQTRALRISPSQQPNSSVPGGLAFSPDGKRLFARGKSAVLVWDLIDSE